MDIQFYGANCLSLTAQGVRVLIDDTLQQLGAKTAAKQDDIALFTGVHPEPVSNARITIDRPGEYEVAGVSITGMPARAHIDEPKQRSTTIYTILMHDIRVLVLGHVYPDLSESDLEQIGIIDVMTVPVGGNGYTLDATGALGLIKKVEPKVVIPTYYNDDALSLPVPAQDLTQALQTLAMEPKDRTSKLRIKAADFGETTELIVVEKS